MSTETVRPEAQQAREQPELFTEELRAAFMSLRTNGGSS